MRTKVFVLIIFCMPIFCMLSKAQNYGTAKDYLLSKLAVTSTMPFQSFSWLNASCGNDYLLKELTRTRLETVILYHRHAFAIRMSHYGYAKYGELTTSVAYALKLGTKVAVGLQFHYIFQHVNHYESLHSVTFDFSLYAQASRKLSFFFELYNPARLKYGVTGKTVIPMRFTVATLYEFNEKLLFSVKIFKELPGIFDVDAQCCYSPKDFFYLSLDLSLHHVQCGVMLRFRHLYFTTDVKYNYNLGFAPEVGMIYQLPIGDRWSGR